MATKRAPNKTTPTLTLSRPTGEGTARPVPLSLQRGRLRRQTEDDSVPQHPRWFLHVSFADAESSRAERPPNFSNAPDTLLHVRVPGWPDFSFQPGHSKDQTFWRGRFPVRKQISSYRRAIPAVR